MVDDASEAPNDSPPHFEPFSALYGHEKPDVFGEGC